MRTVLFAGVLASTLLLMVPTAPAVAAGTHCGPVTAAVMYLPEGAVDPAPRETIEVAGRTYQSTEVPVIVSAMLELAWVGRQAVCIEEDQAGAAIGVIADLDILGSFSYAATWYTFETGSIAVGPDNEDSRRVGSVHDTLFGFRSIEFNYDQRAPNIHNTWNVGGYKRQGDDRIQATLTWTKGGAPEVEMTATGNACVIVGQRTATTATFTEPVNDHRFGFRLSEGSYVDPGFVPGDLIGVKVAAERGLEGAVTILPLDIEGCSAPPSPSAPEQSEPPATAVPGPTASLAPSPAPTPAATPTPTPAPTPTPSLTPLAAAGSPAGTAVPGGGPIDPSSPGRDDGGMAVVLLLLVAAAGIALAAVPAGIWLARRFGPDNQPTSDGSVPSPSVPPPPPPMPLRPVEAFHLTPREREVLEMVAAGMTNREIGNALFISESTAGVHVSNILGKLGVATRTEAAGYALRSGIVQSESSGLIN